MKEIVKEIEQVADQIEACQDFGVLAGHLVLDVRAIAARVRSRIYGEEAMSEAWMDEVDDEIARHTGKEGAFNKERSDVLGAMSDRGKTYPVEYESPADEIEAATDKQRTKIVTGARTHLESADLHRANLARCCLRLDARIEQEQGEIASLRAERDRLRKALETIAYYPSTSYEGDEVVQLASAALTPTNQE